MKSKFPEQQQVKQNDSEPLTDDRKLLTDDGLKRNEVETENEVETNSDNKLFTPKEIVYFVNKTFGKEFTERNLTRFNRDLINDLITAHGYSKQQVLKAWGNILKSDFHRNKNFNMISFSYLSETKTIEQFVSWKDVKIETESTAPTMAKLNLKK
jgi:hypothetical protein